MSIQYSSYGVATCLLLEERHRRIVVVISCMEACVRAETGSVGEEELLPQLQPLLVLGFVLPCGSFIISGCFGGGVDAHSNEHVSVIRRRQ